MDHKENPIADQIVTSESHEHEIRLGKVKKIVDDGGSPWPSSRGVSHTALQAHTFGATDEIISVAGRLMTRRDHGKTFFCNLADRSGTIQLYIKKDTLGDEQFESFKKIIDIGDIVWVSGSLFTTKTGELTVKVLKLELLSKCLHPLPEKFHGLTDIEQRYRQRYLDLMCNPESKEKFKKRSAIIQSIRSFLTGHDFMEVETPMLHPIPGGATARPFITHHNTFDMALYLRIAPELYLKRLVVGGFERVFEINRNFRNEGISTRHNPEFTMLEFYMAHGTYIDGMALTEKLIQDAVLSSCNTLSLQFGDKTISVEAPFQRLTMAESIIAIGGLTSEQIKPETIDPTLQELSITIPSTAGYGSKLFAIFEHRVESNIIQPTFIIGYPIEVSPLAQRDENNPEQAARFELFICGMEFANGFSELNDPLDQAQRFKDQVKARDAGDQEAHHYDADYIKALEYGLPPTVGVGIGIDRLVMLLTNTQSIKDVILFPTLKRLAE